MKTLKFLVVLIVLSFLPLTNTDAQVQKVVTTETILICDEPPCAGEELCGEIEVVYTEWRKNNQIKKYQLNYSGFAEGQTSYVLYKVNEVENTHGYFGSEGKAHNHNHVLTIVLKKVGGPVIVIHSMLHINWDANGEIKMEFDKFLTSCE